MSPHLVGCRTNKSVERWKEEQAVGSAEGYKRWSISPSDAEYAVLTDTANGVGNRRWGQRGARAEDVSGKTSNGGDSVGGARPGFCLIGGGVETVKGQIEQGEPRNRGFGEHIGGAW